MKPTVEQLQELTDSELSEAILRKLKPDVNTVNCECSFAYEAENGLRGNYFDINSWSDMGALANKHGIGSLPTFAGWNAFYVDSDEKVAIQITHENELRAKAMVFLLMTNKE